MSCDADFYTNKSLPPIVITANTSQFEMALASAQSVFGRNGKLSRHTAFLGNEPDPKGNRQDRRKQKKVERQARGRGR